MGTFADTVHLSRYENLFGDTYGQYLYNPRKEVLYGPKDVVAMISIIWRATLLHLMYIEERNAKNAIHIFYCWRNIILHENILKLLLSQSISTPAVRNVYAIPYDHLSDGGKTIQGFHLLNFDKGSVVVTKLAYLYIIGDYSEIYREELQQFCLRLQGTLVLPSAQGNGETVKSVLESFDRKISSSFLQRINAAESHPIETEAVGAENMDDFPYIKKILQNQAMGHLPYDIRHHDFEGVIRLGPVSLEICSTFRNPYFSTTIFLIFDKIQYLLNFITHPLPKHPVQLCKVFSKDNPKSSYFNPKKPLPNRIIDICSQKCDEIMEPYKAKILEKTRERWLDLTEIA